LDGPRHHPKKNFENDFEILNKQTTKIGGVKTYYEHKKRFMGITKQEVELIKEK